MRRDGDRNNGGNNPLAIVGFILLALAPLAAKAMQAAISRQRETLADVSACQMTRYPPGLISALEKLQADTTVTHLNLYDKTVEGFRHVTKPMFSVQYHPEASPGPHDADYLFRQFLESMEKR